MQRAQEQRARDDVMRIARTNEISLCRSILLFPAPARLLQQQAVVLLLWNNFFAKAYRSEFLRVNKFTQ
jgi:hypothetical protein